MKKLAIIVIISIFGGLIFSIIQVWKIGAKIDNQKIEYEKKFDSIKSFYASMVVPCVPDTAFQVTIPENVKGAWLDYCVAVKIAQEKFLKIQDVAEKTKETAIEKFSKELEKKNNDADESYNKVERKAFSQYVKENPLYMFSLPENGSTYIYFESDENFWSANVTFEIGKSSYSSKEKCPESFRKLLTECKKANSDRVQIKDLAKRIFDKQKEEFEKRCKESVAPAQKIYQETAKLAYIDFLSKININKGNLKDLKLKSARSKALE